MALDPVTLLGLIAVAAALAVALSPWWLLFALALAGWWAFDRWARPGRDTTLVGPKGTTLPLADAVDARNPPYVIGDFLSRSALGRDGMLRIRLDQIDEIVRQCGRECRRVGHPDPPLVQVVEALAPYCAECGLPYSPALVRGAWWKSTARARPDLSPGALPTEDGRCPRCGCREILLVFED